MLVVALIVNNIQRRYPVFWFKPIIEPPAPVEPALGGPEEDGDDDEEKPKLVGIDLEVAKARSVLNANIGACHVKLVRHTLIGICKRDSLCFAVGRT